MFYWAVVQAVLMFGTKACVLLVAISQNLEGVHVGFLRQMTGQKAKRQRDGTWRIEAAEEVPKESVTQTLGAYIDKRQATVAEWVTLRPILEICDRETGYEGGGRRRKPWWWQTVAQKQLVMTLEETFLAARERLWEFGRGGKGRGVRDIAKSDAGRNGLWYDGMETCDACVGK